MSQPRTVAEAAREDPRVVRSRALIMEAATRCFLADGYTATSVDDVAAEAGVSKRTVYNVFTDKEELFRAILGQAIDTAERFSSQLVTAAAVADDPEAALRALARELAASVLSGRVVPLRRLLIGEVPRFPDLAADYHRRAPQRVMSAIAGMLDELRSHGVLGFDDAEIAAEHFAFLAIGASLDRALFEPETGGAEATAVAEAAVARADAGAAAFLRAYRVR